MKCQMTACCATFFIGVSDAYAINIAQCTQVQAHFIHQQSMHLDKASAGEHIQRESLIPVCALSHPLMMDGLDYVLYRRLTEGEYVIEVVNGLDGRRIFIGPFRLNQE